MITVEQYNAKLAEFGGVLEHGFHLPGSGKCCASELDHVIRGKRWSSLPGYLPSLVCINDAYWESDDSRTEHMLPLMSTLSMWSKWSRGKKIKWAEVVAVQTVRELLPIALYYAAVDDSMHCKKVKNLAEAENATILAMRAAREARTYPTPGYALVTASQYAENAAKYTLHFIHSINRPNDNFYESISLNSRLVDAAALCVAASSCDFNTILLACRIWKESAEE